MYVGDILHVSIQKDHLQTIHTSKLLRKLLGYD
jgi:hypothetical protein